MIKAHFAAPAQRESAKTSAVPGFLLSVTLHYSMARVYQAKQDFHPSAKKHTCPQGLLAGRPAVG
jgi:hypothetical protein